VADFANWKPVFYAGSVAQKAAGMTNTAGSRGIENPNNGEIPPKEFLKRVYIGTRANVLL